MRIMGKTALVTGGTDGIGLEVARQLKQRGAIVAVCGRDAGRLASAKDAGFQAIEADLSTQAGCDRVVDELSGVPLDILVNNAGTSGPSDLLGDFDLEQTDRAIFLNLNAPMHLIAAFLPAMRERPEAAIVNVTSGLAIAPRGAGPVYCATKAGLRSFTQTLRYQLRNTRITVTEALPPVVETRMTEQNRHKKMSAPDCAAAIVKAIETGQEQAYIGATKLLRAVSEVSPALARRIMIKY
ncbi:putative oxidoreductase [Sphingomonas changbaiensis NBRC 104936]|uniref:Putative oxidoreductase n=1 Tax=Sphingomonas changbaiensis NBRC 104936 TaxID=1219043 RepID=A0A0E9MMG3_9SPHN|nr:SDR family NAD(P)-dependent oxidoreductase [Sphingomonas changbaiensis]GAO38698.1 putative oxidoreductase [Sphingomonas changbaiensis NBRC 104936]